ncbi:hypothetical protein BKA69DRAFT_1094312 [Paraphysoderma sedebokerense]|nr:hypothetical protein BKA69DRAFT_1094312 [Paraphysoderma sedebokerense]
MGKGFDCVPYDTANVASIVDCINQAKPDVVILIPPSTDDKKQVTTNLIEACKKCNVGYVVLVSCVGVDEGVESGKKRLSEFKEFEDKVRNAGFKSYCIVRPSFYTQNLLLYAKQMREKAIIPIPAGRGAFTPIDLHDVAYCLEKICHTIDQSHHGQTYTIMGPENVDGPGLAELATKATGVNYDYLDIKPDQAENLLKSVKDEFQLDEAEMDVLLEMYDLIRDKKLEYFTDDLRRIFGNNGSGIEKFLDTNRELLVPL